MKRITIIIILLLLTPYIKVNAMTKEDVINLANSITLCSNSNSSLIKGIKTSYIRMINERDISEKDLNTIYNNINKAVNILNQNEVCDLSDKSKLSSKSKNELTNLYNETNKLILNSPKITTKEDTSTSKSETNIVIDKNNEEIKIYDNGVLSDVIKNNKKLNYVGVNKTIELTIVVLSLILITLLILKILKINHIIVNSLLYVIILIFPLTCIFKEKISTALDLLSVMKNSEKTVQKDTVVIDNKIVSYPSYGTNYGNITINKETGNIYFGDSTTILKKGIGQLSTSKLPGENGTTILSGHNTGIFKELNNLNQNDIITIQTTYGKFKYKVVKNKIVKDTETSALEQKYDLIMYTCYPNKDIYGNKRLIIYADLISSEFYGDTNEKNN